MLFYPGRCLLAGLHSSGEWKSRSESVRYQRSLNFAAESMQIYRHVSIYGSQKMSEWKEKRPTFRLSDQRARDPL